jgi:3-methyladenine DNA glycosylase AlkD
MIEFDRKSVFDLIKHINLLTEKPLDLDSLNEVFDAFFIKSQEKINSVISDSPEVIETRSTEDILTELLLLSREQSNTNNELLRMLMKSSSKHSALDKWIDYENNKKYVDAVFTSFLKNEKFDEEGLGNAG